MVRFMHDPNPIANELIQEHDIADHQTELNKQEELTGEPFDIFTPDHLDEFDCSFADSFLDFDSLKDLISDSPHCIMPADDVNNESIGGICDKVEVFDAVDGDSEMGSGGICEVEKESNVGGCGMLSSLNLETGVIDKSCRKDEDLGCLIEEELKKVSIGNAANDVKFAESCFASDNNVYGGGGDIARASDEVAIRGVTSENGKSDTLKGSGIESENENASSSSSSEVTSSDDEDWSSWKEGRKGKEVDLEEGEIRMSDVDEMVAWSDEEDDEDEDFKGPIRSKNELPILPPVPLVNETLQPHHQTLPVGVVSAIIGAQVVVEGVEKHNPLSDGSILWITESRSPLGIVDEIFGPVRNPYYTVRYNCESEIPAGIHRGTLISFVPEFANHVLNEGNLYKKGYDASGDNDEEVSADEEFSDDEKEAEYKRMLKMNKRGTNDQKVGNKRKDKKKVRNRFQNWKHDHTGSTGAQPENVKPPVDESQNLIPHGTGSSDQGSHPNSSFQGQRLGNRPDSVPSFVHQQQAPQFSLPPSGAWNNMISCQQPQGTGFPITLQTIGMQWPQQCHPQQMYQMSLPNGVPLQQQFNPGPPPNFILPFVQPNIVTGQASAPWPASGQNGFNQPPFGMGGFPGQLAPTPINSGGEGPVSRPQTGGNNNSQPPAAVPGNVDGYLNFNQGNHFGGGRNANFQGGGRFGPQARDSSNSQPPAAVPLYGPKTGENNNSHPPAAVPGSINGRQNFNEGNRFGGCRRGNRGRGGRFGRGRGRGRRN